MDRGAVLGAIWLGIMACPSSAQETFEGYDCTADCSGHEAGYDWAERNGVTEANDCDGNNQSFNEGCQAFVEEQQPLPDEEDTSDENDVDDSE
ncbi:hypothetical protein [Mesorhizobium sp.]|uniref:hypothetical protein n=1 Tax=Mesorhizobium sp. TaxID=1871066 RepID=UPI00257EBDD6|nr:hypothetical protein [Mesorhizobium sp.]